MNFSAFDYYHTVINLSYDCLCAQHVGRMCEHKQDRTKARARTNNNTENLNIVRLVCKYRLIVCDRQNKLLFWSSANNDGAQCALECSSSAYPEWRIQSHWLQCNAKHSLIEWEWSLQRKTFSQLMRPVPHIPSDKFNWTHFGDRESQVDGYSAHMLFTFVWCVSRWFTIQFPSMLNVCISLL